MLIMLTSYKSPADLSDAVGACGWSVPWGRMRLSVCNGQCPRPKRAVAGAASNDSNNIAAIGHP